MRWLNDLDELLRGERTRPQALAERGLAVRAFPLVIVIVLLCMIYGVCMGSFSLLKEVDPQVVSQQDRYMQGLASTVKTPALFFLTLLVTMPSLYVFNALVGSRLRFLELFRLLIASLAINAAVLASLGPIVAFFSVSTTSHAFVVLLNVAVFAVAGGLGLSFLLQTLHRMTESIHRREAARELVDNAMLPNAVADEPLAPGESTSDADPTTLAEALREPSALDMPQGDVLADHTRTVFGCWVVLFALVGAQMGWMLRPFIGKPELPFTWFRERQSNFFAAVLHMLKELLFGTGDGLGG